MKHRISSKLIAGALASITIAALQASVLAQCPAHVVRENVPIDTSIVDNPSRSADLPDGWFAYTKGTFNTDGSMLIDDRIYYSAINKFEEKSISSSVGIEPSDVAISDNGKFVLARNDTVVYLFNVEKNTKHPLNISARDVHFYRSSPLRSTGADSVNLQEIVYRPTTTTDSIQYRILKAISVDVSADTPVVDTERTILELELADKAFLWEGTYRVARNHIFTQIALIDTINRNACCPRNYQLHLMYFTMPDNGTSKATWADKWTYLDQPPDSSVFGCGLDIAADGETIVWNVGSQGLLKANDPYYGGDMYCVPNRESHFDHKGMAIGDFKDKDDPQVTLHGHVDSISAGAKKICWVPEACRVHSQDTTSWYRELDHSSSYFSNDGQYFVCHETSAIATFHSTVPFWGIWLVEWQAGKWTLLTPKGTKALNAAVHINNPLSAKHNPAIMAPYMSDARLAAIIYDIRGRIIAKKANVDRTSGAMPAGIYIAGNHMGKNIIGLTGK